jgi:hypothetical protein
MIADKAAITIIKQIAMIDSSNILILAFLYLYNPTAESVTEFPHDLFGQPTRFALASRIVVEFASVRDDPVVLQHCLPSSDGLSIGHRPPKCNDPGQKPAMYFGMDIDHAIIVPGPRRIGI